MTGVLGGTICEEVVPYVSLKRIAVLEIHR